MKIEQQEKQVTNNATTSKAKLSTSEWVIVTKKKVYKFTIPLASLVRATDTEKKNYAFNMIKDIPYRTSISITKINDMKVITVFFSNEEYAVNAIKILISQEC